MTWRLHPEAAAEYLAAVEYYVAIDAALGQAFVRCFESAIGDICECPAAWQLVGPSVRRHCLTRFPYGIYYQTEDDRLLVLAVLHMKRRPGAWSSRR
jgi:toxin ParE1/3/4